MKKIIAIDFDGTIVDDAYPNIGGIKAGALNAINELYAHYYIIINTCRKGEQLADALFFLHAKGFKFHAVNENHPELVKIHGDTRKIHADIFVDTNNIGGMPAWGNVVNVINRQLNGVQYSVNYALNDIVTICDRITPGNVAHQACSIKSIALNQLSLS